ncbi:MAG: hypothetical protein WCA20_32225, partial [Candidatus Sulfotelmatobacter sp.]
LLFPGIFRKPVVAQFDQREGSSDGGALLLKAADRHYDLVAGLRARPLSIEYQLDFKPAQATGLCGTRNSTRNSWSLPLALSP